jgi:uncharacterized protein
MRVLIVADDDSCIRALTPERLDLVVSCGDFASDSLLHVIQAVSPQRVFAVKGNHDDSGPFPAPIEDIHLCVATYLGVSFGGFCGSWRYKPKGNFLYEQYEVTRMLAEFPAVDVFVTHNSPRHVHDRDDDVHLGFTAFGDYIDRCKPRLLIHGHQHQNKESLVGSTRILGVYGTKHLEL